MSVTDDEMMQRAVALARQGEGFVRPNPLVGCVLVRDDKVVGEGWHRGKGALHAEADAIRNAGELARGATAYVTLEPCNHYGSTPPCTEGLIEAGVAEVVYAVTDPNPVAAGGAERLRAAGIKVRQFDVEGAAEALVTPWLHSLTSPRPYTYAKLAMSLDGRTATRTGNSKWITSTEARMRGHDLRQMTDAIIVGVGTVLADDPGLDPRPASVAPAPSIKVVMDSQLRTPPAARLLTSPGTVIIACAPDAPDERRRELEKVGVEILSVPHLPSGLSLDAVLRHLKAQGCVSVMLEGGGTLLGSAFDAGLVDEVWAFVAPVILGGGRPAIAGQGPDLLASAYHLKSPVTEQLGPDLLIRGRIERETAACLQVS